MGRKVKIVIALLLVAAVFAGCGPIAIDQLYCLPQKSEEFTNLQSAIEDAMGSSDFCASVAGSNQQVVQSADLDGDGISEYLVFARDGSEGKLRIFVFGGSGQGFALLDSVQLGAAAFDRVEYVDMRGSGGCEIVVGCMLSDDLLRTVQVYSLAAGQLELQLSKNYTDFLTADLDNDGVYELMTLKPGDDGQENTLAELFRLDADETAGSVQITLPKPVQQIRGIVLGKLTDGQNAVFVTSATDNGIQTHVLSLVNGRLENVTVSSEFALLLPADINSDGILEIPERISMRLPEDISEAEGQQLIRWFSVAADGTYADQLCTYHNFAGGWYLRLDSAIASELCVIQQGSSYEFSIWNDDGMQRQTLFTVYALTGQKREEQAIANNRFVLHRTDSTVYAAKLEVASAAYGMSRDSMVNSFYRILPDWISGET